jgi:hypothetical protein
MTGEMAEVVGVQVRLRESRKTRSHIQDGTTHPTQNQMLDRLSTSLLEQWWASESRRKKPYILFCDRKGFPKYGSNPEPL